jgi:hypothetical protein
MLGTLALLTVVCGGGAYLWRARSRKRARSGPAKEPRPSEPARPREAAQEEPSVRGPAEAKTHDVITHMERDYVVEGVLRLRVDGGIVRLARLVDAREVRWMLVGWGEIAILRAEGERPALPPPDSLHVQGLSFTEHRNGHVSVDRHGDCGPRTQDRCRFWLYTGTGQSRAWIDDFPDGELLLGEVVLPQMIDLLPGS